MRKEYFKINKKRYAKMTKAKTVDTVRERELYFTNIEYSLVRCGNKINLIKIQEGRNTFIGVIKETDYK
jgi:hypothetical protein